MKNRGRESQLNSAGSTLPALLQIGYQLFELSERKGFLYVSYLVSLQKLLHFGNYNVARHDDYARQQIGSLAPYSFEQPEPRHARHFEIRQDHVISIVHDMSPSGFSLVGRIHVVASSDQRAVQIPRDLLLIVHYKHPLRDDIRVQSHLDRRTHGCRFVHSNRNFHIETGPLVGRAFNPEPAFMFFDDAIRNRQTESRAFARFFGRKKRVENLRKMRGGYAGTVVLQPYLDTGLSFALNGSGVDSDPSA